MNSLVSVIIPVYNCRYVLNAVESVLRQTYPYIEIIVVDDGSTEDIYSILKPYKGKFIYIKQENAGPSKARNTGILNAKGDFIYFLDADDRLTPEAVELGVSCLEKYPNVGMSFGGAILFNEDGIIKYWSPGPAGPPGRYIKELFIYNFIQPGCIIIRRNCFDIAGLFDENVELCEDYDLGLRIAWYFDIVNLNKFVLFKRKHPSSLSYKNIKMEEWRFLVLKKFLKLFPEAEKEVGPKIVRDIMSKTSFDLGYGFWDRGEFIKARKYFKESFKTRPHHFIGVFLYLCTFLPPSQISRLRYMKRVLMGYLK